MKKFFPRSFLPRLLCCILFLMTFLPHPRANVLFSHNSPKDFTKNPPPMSAPNAKSHDFCALISQPCDTQNISSKNPPALPAKRAPSYTFNTPAQLLTDATKSHTLTTPNISGKTQNPLPMSATNTQNYLFPSVGSYACILSDNTYFYASADERRGLFLLPQTYYVRLLEYRSDYCKVEYQTDGSNAKRLVGYARTADLTFVTYTPARPYLYYTFDLHYKIEDTAQTDSTFLTELTLSCVYYGDYIIGSERYCYVLRGEEFGYVPKPLDLQYEDNPEYADYLASLTPAPAPSDSTSDETVHNSSPAQIAILVAICLLVPILAALVLKPPRRPPYELDD